MPVNKRVQMLMEPKDYERLAGIARQEGVSVGELIRRAVRERYPSGSRDRAAALERLMSMNLPVLDWQQMETEIEEAHDAGIPR